MEGTWTPCNLILITPLSLSFLSHCHCHLAHSPLCSCVSNPSEGFRWGHRTLVNSLCPSLASPAPVPISPLKHTRAQQKNEQSNWEGVSVKPEPVITIWSSTSDLSAGQHWTLLSAPAPGSRVTARLPSCPRPHRSPSLRQGGGAEGESKCHTVAWLTVALVDF